MSSETRGLEKLLLALQLERLDKDLFRSVLLWTPRNARGTFGGQLVAHVVEAAHRSTSGHLVVHSMHSSFLAPGNSRKHIYYHVKRLRDGRSFATRLVVARQDGEAIFVATVGFHSPEQPGVRHSPCPPPTLTAPEEAKSEREFIDGVLRAKTSEQFRQNMQRMSAPPPSDAGGEDVDIQTAEQLKTISENQAREDRQRSSVDRRQYSGAIGGEAFTPERRKGAKSIAEEPEGMLIIRYVDGPGRSNQPAYSWMRANIPASYSRELPPGSPLGCEKTPEERLHLLLGCWLSDYTLALAGLRPHGIPNDHVRMLVSLDHTIYFHRPQTFRVNEWFLYEVFSPFADNNRTLNMGRIFSNGQLQMTTIQESLVRMERGFLSEVDGHGEVHQTVAPPPSKL